MFFSLPLRGDSQGAFITFYPALRIIDTMNRFYRAAKAFGLAPKRL